jgi:UDP:flavonoid glycosyltransferase YjiC (YdhE family)
VKLGLGPDTCDFKKITKEAVSSAITDCISNANYRKNAESISKKLRNSDGIELTVQLIEREFDK